jgi:uncharacterized membrane protein YuzA (DUF378 family)
MEMIKRLEPIALLLMIVGSLSWAVIALFDENVLSEVFGTGTLLDVVYVVIGAAGLISVPRLLDGLHMGHRHGPHPRGV